MNGILHKLSKIWEGKEHVAVPWKLRKSEIVRVIQYCKETEKMRNEDQGLTNLLRKISWGALGMEAKLEYIEKPKAYDGKTIIFIDDFSRNQMWSVARK